MAKNKIYRLGMYEKSMPKWLSWEEKLLIAKKCGFDWVEISIDETDDKLARLDWTQEEIADVKRAMDLTGVKIETMCLSGHRKYPLGSLNDETVDRSLKIMEKAINLSVQLGVRIIQLAGYDVYYETSSPETVQRFEENLKKCVEMASRKGVILAFETMETPFMDTVGKAMHYVTACNSPYLQVYPDIGNLTNASVVYHHEVLDDLALGQGHIVAAHLKETKPGIYREVPFGTGHTKFEEEIDYLLSIGVRMFTGEFWYTGEENWEEICKESGAFLRAHIDHCMNHHK